LFHLPLTQQAADEYFCLKDWISNLQRDPQAADAWHWPGKHGYTAKGFYNLMHSHMPTDQSCAWIWRSKWSMKIKVFGWLLMFDKLNTKDLLVRRHWRPPTEDNSCVMCHSHALEDRLHLFFSCNFSCRVWNYLQITWGANGSLHSCLQQAKDSFGQSFFMEVMLTASWCIWIVRNGKTFRNERPSFHSWRRHFVHDITLLSHRLQGDPKNRLISWINSLH